MADFVGDHVGLREFAGGAEAIAELVKKEKIEIDLFVARAIDRAGGRSGLAAGRVCLVAKQNQLGVTVIGDQLVPVGLRVVKDERNELDFAGLGRFASGISRSAHAW